MSQSELEKKVVDTILENQLIEDNDKIVIGVSGGPDSVCLLNILNDIKKNWHSNLEPMPKIWHSNLEPMPKFDIVVAHVNHLLREEAKDDEEFVKEFCKKRQLEFYSKSIDIKKIVNTNKIGTEEAGRKARYGFFNEIAEQTGANKIAVAHNKNDNVETILMHLMRGCGISGLKGIEAKRGNIIRPLINCQRYEIEEYCRQENLEPVIDKTNQENIYTRNKVRNILIPYMQKEFNSNIIESISRLSELVREDDEYIDKQVMLAYKDMLLEEKNIISNYKETGTFPMAVLDLKKFNKQEKVIKARIILYTITRLFGDSSGIEKIHIEDIIKLCENNIGNKYLTPNKKIKILIKNHKIHFISQI